MDNPFTGEEPRRAEVADEVVDAAPRATYIALVDDVQAIINEHLAAIEREAAATPRSMANKDEAEALRKLRQRCVKFRGAMDDAYERGNKPLLAASKKAREIVAAAKERIRAIEEPVDALIKADERAAAERRAAAAAAETKRIEGHEAQLAVISGLPGKLATADVAAIEESMLWLSTYERDWEEFAERAKALTAETLEALTNVRQRAVDAAELKRLREQQAEEARRREAEHRAALEAQMAERARAKRVADAIYAITLEPQVCQGLASHEIAEAIKNVTQAKPPAEANPDEIQAFKTEIESTLVTLRGMHDREVGLEQERTTARQQAERLAELERAERERQDKEAEAAAAEVRKRAEEAATEQKRQQAEADERLRAERAAWEESERARLAAEQRVRDNAEAMLAALRQIRTSAVVLPSAGVAHLANLVLELRGIAHDTIQQVTEGEALV